MAANAPTFDVDSVPSAVLRRGNGTARATTVRLSVESSRSEMQLAPTLRSSTPLRADAPPRGMTVGSTSAVSYRRARADLTLLKAKTQAGAAGGKAQPHKVHAQPDYAYTYTAPLTLPSSMARASDTGLLVTFKRVGGATGGLSLRPAGAFARPTSSSVAKHHQPSRSTSPSHGSAGAGSLFSSPGSSPGAGTGSVDFPSLIASARPNEHAFNRRANGSPGSGAPLWAHAQSVRPPVVGVGERGSVWPSGHRAAPPSLPPAGYRSVANTPSPSPVRDKATGLVVMSTPRGLQVRNMHAHAEAAARHTGIDEYEEGEGEEEEGVPAVSRMEEVFLPPSMEEFLPPFTLPTISLPPSHSQANPSPLLTASSTSSLAFTNAMLLHSGGGKHTFSGVLWNASVAPTPTGASEGVVFPPAAGRVVSDPVTPWTRLSQLHSCAGGGVGRLVEGLQRVRAHTAHAYPLSFLLACAAEAAAELSAVPIPQPPVGGWAGAEYDALGNPTTPVADSGSRRAMWPATYARPAPLSLWLWLVALGRDLTLVWQGAAAELLGLGGGDGGGQAYPHVQEAVSRVWPAGQYTTGDGEAMLRESDVTRGPQPAALHRVRTMQGQAAGGASPFPAPCGLGAFPEAAQIDHLLRVIDRLGLPSLSLPAAACMIRAALACAGWSNPGTAAEAVLATYYASMLAPPSSPGSTPPSGMASGARLRLVREALGTVSISAGRPGLGAGHGGGGGSPFAGHAFPPISLDALLPVGVVAGDDACREGDAERARRACEAEDGRLSALGFSRQGIRLGPGVSVRIEETSPDMAQRLGAALQAGRARVGEGGGHRLRPWQVHPLPVLLSFGQAAYDLLDSALADTLGGGKRGGIVLLASSPSASLAANFQFLSRSCWAAKDADTEDVTDRHRSADAAPPIAASCLRAMHETLYNPSYLAHTAPSLARTLLGCVGAVGGVRRDAAHRELRRLCTSTGTGALAGPMGGRSVALHVVCSALSNTPSASAGELGGALAADSVAGGPLAAISMCTTPPDAAALALHARRVGRGQAWARLRMGRSTSGSDVDAGHSVIRKVWRDVTEEGQQAARGEQGKGEEQVKT